MGLYDDPVRARRDEERWRRQREMKDRPLLKVAAFVGVAFAVIVVIGENKPLLDFLASFF